MTVSARRMPAIVVITLISALVASNPQARAATGADSLLTAHVAIDAGHTVAAFPSTALGLGLELWDGHQTDPVIPQLIKADGFGVLRYPGGSYGDIYHWKTNSATPGATIQPGNDFDDFMTIAKRVGAQVLITANYGSNASFDGGGDPAEAAAWVDYANNVKHYGVKYWEIGNEVYGNGFYNGSAWEEDLHAPTHPVPAGKSSWTPDPTRLHNPALGPETYGANVNAYAAAMKAKDRSIKVGAVLICGGWPDHVDPDWNSNVLKLCGPNIDFVVIHWYGGGKTPGDLFADEEKKLPAIAQEARQLVDQYCGARSKNVQIWLTEGDAGGYDCEQPGALFAADMFPRWIENGIDSFCWWDLHNGIYVKEDGKSYDDQGILSNASSDKGISEPPANTPFPPYYGIQMVSRFISSGDSLLKTTVPADSSLWAHASRRKKDGSLSILLINKDPAKPVKVELSCSGLSLARSGMRYDYLPGSAAISSAAIDDLGPSFTVTVPAYSISLIDVASLQHGKKPKIKTD